MFPIYGLGVLLEPIGKYVDRWIGDGFGGSGITLNTSDRLVRHGMLYMVLIFVAEYGTGVFLKTRGVCPWDYSGRNTNINGLIRLDFAPLWFATGLLFEQITKKKSDRT